MGMKRLNLDSIRPNKDQPRKDFQEIAELALSIEAKGLQQPITVRPIKDENGESYHEIVMGERRYRATYLLWQQGRITEPTILCHVRAMSDDQRDTAAIIENLQRQDITPFEEAAAFKRELDKGKTVEQLAKELGLAQTWRITYRVRLLQLEPTIAKLAQTGALSCNAAQDISKLPHHEQVAVVQKINAGRLSSDAQIGIAVNALLFKESQPDFDLDCAQGPSEVDMMTVNRMERTIEGLCLLIAKGWKDGECVTAVKVSPDRAGHFADQLKFAAKTLADMEKQLRTASVQRDMLVA